MPNTESLVFDLLVRDKASAGLSDIGKAADGASRNTDALTKRLNELSRKSVEARVKLAGDKEALASLDKMDARLISLDRRVASPNMKVEGAARAIAEISAVDLELGKLGGKGGTADVATSSLDKLMAKLGPSGLSGGAGMGALIGAGVALSPVLATVGTGLAGVGVAAYGTIAPIIAAAGATGGLKANMSTLSPVQQQMARELLALEGQASAFSKSLQPEVVKLWGDGMTTASVILKDIQPVAKATGDALHGVLGSINASFATGPWHDFFGFMAQTAGPDTALLGKVLVDLLNDLPPLMIQMQPLARLLLVLADGALKAVAGLERMHVMLPLLGASIGLVVAGPLGALVGALAGGAVQLGAWSDAADQARIANQKLIAQLPDAAHLAAATSVNWAAVAKSMSGTAAGTQALQAAALAAHPAVGTLAGDMAILASTTSQSTLALQAYSDLWNIFVGNAVSDQQAVLNVTAAFEAYSKTAQNAKKTSTQVQQAFLSIFTALGTGLDALHKNGASVQQVNDLYTTTIGRLNAMHGLTPAQRADVQGLTRDYLAWANSVTGLSGNVVKAAGSLRDNFLSAMSLTHRLVPTAKADADALAASILKTGTNSRATAGDRQRLINDLVHSGLSAAQAKADVLQFQGQIDKLKGKTVPIGATFSGAGKITASQSMTGGTVQTVGNLLFVAKGGRVPGSGTGDTVPAMLTPGEVVIPRQMVAAGAVDHLRGTLPGFASGGLVGTGTDLAGIAPFGGRMDARFGAFAGRALARAAESAIVAAITAAVSGGGWSLLHPTGTGGSIRALMQSMAASIGWTGALWNALDYVEMREAGYSLTATNPGSGAYGLAQFINGPGEYYQYGGNPNTAVGQITGFFNYIRQRYGNPIAAANHEAAFNWYDQGGYLAPGLTLAYNGTGVPERVLPPGGGGSGTTYVINVHASPLASPADTGRAVVGAIQQYEKRSGKGWRS